MNKIRIPWWEPRVGKKEKELVNQVLQSNFLNDGKYTEKFENEIARLVNSRYAVSVTSGTAAMFLSLKALGIGYLDEVIIPDMTFIATANAVEMCGAKPVLVDVNSQGLIITSSIKKAINKKTKAIIPVHVSGRGADMRSIIKIAKEHKLFIVEDAAEAFMSKQAGKFLGTFGNMGCFSFSPPKIITTGQGGMIVTDNKKFYSQLRELKDQGRPNRGTGGDDIHLSVGYNFKFTNLQAAVGLGQLSYLRARIKRVTQINKLYRKYLSGVKEISIFDIDLKNGGLPLWTDCLVSRKDELVNFLRSKGVDCRKFWFPLHTQKPYRTSDEAFPNSSKLSQKALWLPSAFTITDTDVKHVCKLIKKFLEDEKST